MTKRIVRNKRGRKKRNILRYACQRRGRPVEHWLASAESIQRAPDFLTSVQAGLNLAVQLTRAQFACLHFRDTGKVHLFEHKNMHLGLNPCADFFTLFDHDVGPLRPLTEYIKEMQEGWPRHLSCLLVPLFESNGQIQGVLQLGSDLFGFKGNKYRPFLRQFAQIYALGLEVQQTRARERLLRRSAQIQKKRYESFLDNTSEGVLRFEVDRPLPIHLPVQEQVENFYRHLYLAEGNQAMARMYGYQTSQEMVGLRIDQFMCREDPFNRGLLEKFIHSGYRLVGAESSGLDRSGELKYFSNCFTGVIERGYFLRAWGTKVDITRHKNLEAQLTRSAEQAAAANKAKSYFLANMSHEIRTPLGVIIGFADLAMDSSDLSDEARGYLSTIRRNGRQLSRILGEVLDLSKIEASRLEIEPLNFPMIPLIEDILALFELKAKENNLRLSFRAHEPLPATVRTDPTRLRQILVNVIGNAIKFTQHGEVLVELKMLTPPKPGFRTQFEFTISDTGIGIAEDKIVNLFQPYAQMDQSTARKYGGTGLGLMLSKELARILGGTLQLKSSRVDHGSVFTFTFDGGPYVENPTNHRNIRRTVEVVGPEGEFLGLRVLLVEDQPDNQLLLRNYLTSMGFEVAVAGDGVEALRLVNTQAFDLIVMDIQMPHLDGHQATRQLRSLGFEKPILALTAHAFKEDRERAFASGFSEYLTKPIQRKTLKQAIARRLSLH